MRHLIAAILAATSACGSPDEEAGIACGENGECPPGYTCEPVSRRCIINSGGAVDARIPAPDAPVGCPTPTGGPTSHTGEIGADEVWTANGSPHLVTLQVRVTGTATLTIEPCAEVLMAKDAVIIAGISGATSTIRAPGTAERPIVIKQRTAGERFSGVEAYHPGRLELSNVTIEGGGSDRFRRGASITGWGDNQPPLKPVLKLDHVTIKDSAGSGLFLDRSATFAPGSTALTVSGSAMLNAGLGEPLYVELAAAPDIPDGDYRANPLPVITLEGGNVDGALALRDPGIPYRLADFASIVVRTGGALQLGPGVELVLHSGSSVDVLGGSLVAAGTADRPVRLRPRSDSAEDRWQTVEVDQPGSLSLTHTILEGGGTDRFVHYASLVARGDNVTPLERILHVDHVQVRRSGGIGVLVERWAAFSETSRDLVVTGSGASQPAVGQPVRIAIPAAGTLPTGTYTGNAIDAIILDTGLTVVVEETLRDRGVPYLATGSLTVRPTTTDGLARLVIEPGVTLRFPKGLFGLIIGSGATGSPGWPGELVAVGTAEKPIVLGSAEAAPAAGDWRGVYFHGYRPTGNRLVHVRVEHAGADCLCALGGCGGPNEAAVMFLTYPLSERPISQSTFAHIAGHGIFSGFRSDDPAPLDMTADNTFEDVSGCKQTMIATSTAQCARPCM